MLIPDKQGGKSGGHQKIEKIKEKKKLYRIEKIIPNKEPEKFKTYIKSIQKLMNECFNEKKYVINIDNKEWIIIFFNKKIVGIITIDNKNVIWNICISSNYRNKGIAKDAIQFAIQNICPSKIYPKLYVDNKEKNYKKLIKLYTKYGFNIVKNDEKITTMEFKCS